MTITVLKMIELKDAVDHLFYEIVEAKDQDGKDVNLTRERNFSDFRLKYLMTKNLLALETEQKIFENLRLELVKKLGTMSDTDNPEIKRYEVKEENRQVFFKEIDNLMKTTIQIELNKFTFDEMNKIASNCPLTSKDILAIDDFLIARELKKE
jgi:hypothetical protein